MRWALSFCLLFAFVDEAEAHHAVSEFGVANVEPRSFFETTLEVGEFEQPTYRGRYQELSFYFEYKIVDWFSASASVPVLRLDIAGDPVRLGMGDPEVAAKFNIYSTKHGGFILSGGVGLEVPLGIGEGMSSDQFELTPFVLASTSPWGGLIINGIVRARFGLGGDDVGVQGSASGLSPAHIRYAPRGPLTPIGGDDASAMGNLMQPHSRYEIGGQLSVAYLVAPVYVLGATDLNVPLASDDPLAASARLEVGVRLGDHVRVAASAELPLTGDRFSRRAGVGVAYIF